MGLRRPFYGALRASKAKEAKVNTDRMLRRAQVLERVGLGRSSLYAMMAHGAFPRPVRIGQRAVAWSERSITDWIASRPVSTGGMM